MTYVEYLRKVYAIAEANPAPWLCWVAHDALAGRMDGAPPALDWEHCDRLRGTIHAQLLGHAFLPAMLREQRPDWPYPGASGKVIRLAWLREQIELAEAEEAGACTPT